MSSVPVKRDARQARPPVGVRLSRVRSSFSVYCARAPLGSSDLLSRLRNAMRDGVSFKNLSFRQPWAMPISHVLELGHVLMHRKLAHAHVHLRLGPVEPPNVVLLKSGIPSNITGKP